MKKRIGPDGVHFFDRANGNNILINELLLPEVEWTVAPRQISVALTNICDLHCKFCYAPKIKASLPFDYLKKWLKEIDQLGTFGVGFGGGEPTLYPKFAEICEFTANETDLAVTFTTHGHRLTDDLLSNLKGNVHFIRISIDGVGTTYEKFRSRKFDKLIERIERTREISSLGFNVVINDSTIQDLDQVTEIAEKFDISEVLLLPQQATQNVKSLSKDSYEKMKKWIEGYGGETRLTISDVGLESNFICNPLSMETGLNAYAHIDALGFLKASSYSNIGQQIGEKSILEALQLLKECK
ncbi:radical SAM protein [Acinetobacter bouvetii]|uniref:Mycofactocin radical SAM maturase MftC n=1 Tax=Acinetobacter bouvetii TaxID=202951 RepID=A0A811GAN1_9GAMM|nr:radical SAM protein [Acinetobacter bouvetii]CAB1216607.1 Putative mycofactocin radical SAM maturase MftC [Acinetobacter bouvetii]